MENKVKIKILISSPEVKVLSVTGNSGDVLEKHRVDHEAVLIVNDGRLIYSEATRQQQLTKGECFLIPANTSHSVNCTEETNFFIVLTTSTKMKFEK